MTDLRQAAQQALEELEKSCTTTVDTVQAFERRSRSINALRAALEQPVFDCPRCGHCCPQTTAQPQNWDNNEINNAP